jgi:hypothetical protein
MNIINKLLVILLLLNFNLVNAQDYYSDTDLIDEDSNSYSEYDENEDGYDDDYEDDGLFDEELDQEEVALKKHKKEIKKQKLDKSKAKYKKCIAKYNKVKKEWEKKRQEEAESGETKAIIGGVTTILGSILMGHSNNTARTIGSIATIGGVGLGIYGFYQMNSAYNMRFTESHQCHKYWERERRTVRFDNEICVITKNYIEIDEGHEHENVYYETKCPGKKDFISFEQDSKIFNQGMRSPDCYNCSVNTYQPHRNYGGGYHNYRRY